MNEDDLGADTGEPVDYFSFRLGYNEDIGTGNDDLYNGNISGMKWSSGLGMADTIMNAYNYDYDALNRITSADYKRATGSPGALAWATPKDDAFSVTGYSYDLNGNLESLHRRGIGGADLDVLTYDYGQGADRSNKLLSVSDAGLDDWMIKDLPRLNQRDWTMSTTITAIWYGTGTREARNCL